MSPRRSFPIEVTARPACACGVGTAAIEIGYPSSPAPVGTAGPPASNDNGGDADTCFKQPGSPEFSVVTLTSFILDHWRSPSVLSGPWCSIS
jgi:hypothetical protein